MLQLDEPSLPAVLGGRVPTPSGYGTVRAVAADTARDRLRGAGGRHAARRVVHCCASEAPIALLREAGADAIALDAALVTTADYDALGEAVDAGAGMLLGVVPTSDGPVDYRPPLARATEIADALGIAPADRARLLVPTPACGLAGATPQQARRALRLARDVGRALTDDG